MVFFKTNLKKKAIGSKRVLSVITLEVNRRKDVLLEIFLQGFP